MLKAAVHSQGCKLNQLEGEAIAGAFFKAGFSLCSFASKESPDIIVINTCTVTSRSDQKAGRIIKKALRDNPLSCVIVTGCLAQLESAKINALENFTGRLFVFKSDEKGSLLDLPFALSDSAPSSVLGLRSFVENWKNCGGGEKKTDGAFLFAQDGFSARARGFLKIQDGCGRSCTFCRARLARGKRRSLPKEAALQGLLRLEEAGYAEAALVGLNITEYEGGLGDLLDYLLCGTKSIAIRLSSLEPDMVFGKLAEIAGESRIRPHFHLALQSGSPAVLEKMGRPYSGETVEKAAIRFRAAKNDPFLACDVMAGFPGETEADFEKTLDLCRRLDFAWMHVFPYSPRPGTAAYNFPQAVSEKETARRAEILQDLARQGRARYIGRWVGRNVGVLVEKSADRKPSCRGLSENYLKLNIRANGKTPAAGSFLQCRILSAPQNGFKLKDYDATAELL